MVWEDLSSNDDLKHYRAVQAGKILKLDLWPVLFQQLVEDPLNDGLYYYLMETEDRERIRRITEFAETRLPLDEIAVGPGEEMGLGPEFKAHGCLDFIIQELDEFEGTGKKLVSASLWSSVVRHRNMALKILAAWKPEFWPEDAKGMLLKLKTEEPDDEVRKKVKELLERNQLLNK